ncbi:dihydroorotate dehydrogenase-like protein [Mangrovimicrobium sediminis]|uniref:Dihydroorotate dehydrogenase-like protein n=1 Tax=Mangrovimicrobium sediminis TaxID=2562682 RepID=A0A4Z0M6N9_9GAMM|nr:dihydroorotate dehydrogenase-like protein [Haliea sp. SAOS-164]TGD75179.1 dihydroorotate dehydrogenase-like protein [Haliea sp. SAOS-164]
MVDLSTRYLGLDLKNPLVPSASPLSRHLDTARRLEDAGAAALVMHSLFEEQIEAEDARLARFFHQQSLGHAEADSFRPVPDNYRSIEEQYLEQLHALKSGLDIPVIASLNGTTNGGWVSYAKSLEEAGADALELNVFYIPAAFNDDGQKVEQRYVDVLSAVREQVAIPVVMKLSAQFTAPMHFAHRLEEAGASGLALFNRFYQPDIDLETLEVTPQLQLSTSEEALLRIRWLAILHGRTQCSLAITGGVHNVNDVAKALLAGADVVHMCSALLRRGPGHLAVVLQALRDWLEQREYASVEQMKGSVSQRTATDSAAFLRANYVNVLDSYQPPPGVHW